MQKRMDEKVRGERQGGERKVRLWGRSGEEGREEERGMAGDRGEWQEIVGRKSSCEKRHR